MGLGPLIHLGNTAIRLKFCRVVAIIDSYHGEDNS